MSIRQMKFFRNAEFSKEDRYLAHATGSEFMHETVLFASHNSLLTVRLSSQWPSRFLKKLNNRLRPGIGPIDGDTFLTNRDDKRVTAVVRPDPPIS